jgi:sigma-B regulation protein RsbU (phosphoserine phosphatase)
MMPDGNGTLLCQRVRANNLPFYTYMILVTSLDDIESTVKGIEAGADDYIRKPFYLEELRARIRSGERVLELEKNLRETNKVLLATREIMDLDIKMAAEMQRSLLPSKTLTTQGVSIDWIFHPSAHLSGDIFNIFPLDSQHIGFYSIDVAGHGVASAMQSFTLSRLLSPDSSYSNLLRYSLPEAPTSHIVRPASEVIANLNQRFQTNASNILYFTMTYGIIDTYSRTIELCQAGHPHPIFQQQGSCAELVANSSLPVGIMPDVNYEVVRLHYHAGDRLFLYSDGITECESPNGEMFGTERLRSFVDETKHLNINQVTAQLDDIICLWRQSDDFDDDISILVLELY